MIFILAESLRSQDDTATTKFDRSKIGTSFNKKNLKLELKNELYDLFKSDIVYFKRRSYGSVFNQPTRNVLMVFEYGNGYIIYYRYVASQSQNRILYLNEKFEIEMKATYCGFNFPESAIDLIEKLNRCGRLIKNI